MRHEIRYPIHPMTEAAVRRTTSDFRANLAHPMPRTKSIVLVGATGLGVRSSPMFDQSIALARLVADPSRVFVVAPYEYPGDLLNRITDACGNAKLRPFLLMRARQATPILREIRHRMDLTTRWAPPVDLLRGLSVQGRFAFLERAITLARTANAT